MKSSVLDKKKFIFSIGIIFFLIILAITLIVWSNNDYNRSLYFFIAISFVFLVILFQVLSIKDEKLTYHSLIILIELIIIFLLITLSQRYSATFYTATSDSFFHNSVVKSIMQTGEIPKNVMAYYEFFPGWHILLAIYQIIINNETSSFLITSLSMIVSIIIIFRLQYELVKNQKVGLLSSVLLVSCQNFLEWGTFLTTTSFTLGIYSIILYCVFKIYDQKHRFRVILLILLPSLLISHHFTTIIVIITFGLLALGETFYNKLITRSYLKSYCGFYLIYMLVIALAYYIFRAVPFFKGSFEVIRSIIFEPTVISKSDSYAGYNFIDGILPQLSNITLIGLLCFGCIFMIMKKRINKKWFLIMGCSSLYVLGVAIPKFMPFLESIPFHRFSFFGLLFAILIVGYATYQFLVTQHRVYMFAIILFVFSFISCSEVAMDTLPLHKDKRGYMSNQLSLCDLKAANFSNKYIINDRLIITDLPMLFYMKYILCHDNVTDNINDYDSNTCNELILRNDELFERGLVFRKGHGTNIKTTLILPDTDVRKVGLLRTLYCNGDVKIINLN